jgi:glucose/arabinose dehydrogenase
MKIFRLGSIISLVTFFLNPSAFAAPILRDSALSVSEVAAGLSVPTTMAFIGVDDILVLQKNDGRVRRVIGGVLQAAPVLDVAVDNASERGLLGIALTPTSWRRRRFISISLKAARLGILPAVRHPWQIEFIVIPGMAVVSLARL